jgi:hypothetical protein
MLVSMVVNVRQMVWEDLHAIVQIHIQVNDVKIVREHKKKLDMSLKSSFF